MLGVPTLYHGNLDSNWASVPSSTIGTTITASGTAHTKGSWTQLIAATTYDWYGFFFVVANSSSNGASSAQLLDIGIGAAASETAIVSNMGVGFTGAFNVNCANQFYMPLFVKAGSRVSARIQAEIVSDTVDVVIFGLAGTSTQTQVFGVCDTYGANTATSGGVLVTGGDGTYSADVNVGSTTSRNYQAIIPSLQSTEATMGSLVYFVDLRIGSATQMKWFASTGTSERVTGPIPSVPHYMPIASGTQLATRMIASGAGADQFSVIYHCFA